MIAELTFYITYCAVSMATGEFGVRIPAGVRIFLPSKIFQTGSWNHPPPNQWVPGA